MTSGKTLRPAAANDITTLPAPISERASRAITVRVQGPAAAAQETDVEPGRAPVVRARRQRLMRGAVVRDHEVLGLLGVGGAAEVYHVRNLVTGQEVALKIPSEATLDRPDLMERLEIEACALSTIDNPGVVRILTCGRDPELGFFIIMEKLVGVTVEVHLKKSGGCLPLDEALHIAIDAGLALERLHRLGIFHRDVKPSNLFLHQPLRDKPYVVKLLDLNAAKLDRRGMRTTRQNLSFGTPAYMSPEHIERDPITHATDVYSLAILVFEMLTGRYPFGPPSTRGATYALWKLWHCMTKPLPLIDVAPQYGARLSCALDRALEKKPRDRFPSMRAFVSALEMSLEPRATCLRCGARSDDDSAKFCTHCGTLFEGALAPPIDVLEAPQPAHESERPPPDVLHAAVVVNAAEVAAAPDLATASSVFAAVRVYELATNGTPVRVGRGAGSGICINHESVSAYHAELRQTDGVWSVTAMAEATGVNGAFVERSALAAGDVVQVGTSAVVLIDPRAAPWLEGEPNRDKLRALHACLYAALRRAT